ncbi:acyl-CoA dehydrogenase family protein [Falsiroseomonas sp.]|uniref:acyl-CoA dehydrogenase family protein n=1 Tax=Falsiroseomonas sp. TaxID=2870721 RepID=UPI002734BD03|nr:acyl-CoA dehydrogenase family protein [Falsiroseomonas sp.]MDP3416306.1 acyl-CoA dehydrogenase family protein [Falsiroseomonas sp.]
MALSGELAALRETARRFAEAEVAPRAADLDETEAFPADIYRALGRLGLLGMTVPEALGGAEAGVQAYAIVMEELSRGYASVADQVGLVELLGTLLSEHGTPAQQARYLTPLLRYETSCAYALTESDAGSDLANLKTTARRDGADWVLNGEKMWIHMAPRADFAAVLARTDPAAGHRGMSIFLADLNAPGVERLRAEHKMGQRASPVGGLRFTDVRLPSEALLGPEGRGFHMMMSVLDKGRIGIAALALGILQRALEESVSYAKQRVQFGKPIAEQQAIRFLIADMAKDAHAARLMVRDAAQGMDEGRRVTLEASMAKCFASDAAVARTADAVQIHGGTGYIRGVTVERLYRDAKITQIYEGTNQIQRVIMAREILS